jgi:hypothetical protein
MSELDAGGDESIAIIPAHLSSHFEVGTHDRESDRQKVTASYAKTNSFAVATARLASDEKPSAPTWSA